MLLLLAACCKTLVNKTMVSFQTLCLSLFLPLFPRAARAGRIRTSKRGAGQNCVGFCLFVCFFVCRLFVCLFVFSFLFVRVFVCCDVLVAVSGLF